MGALAEPINPQHRQRFVSHLIGTLLTVGRKTLSGILCSLSQQQHDWTAHYRLYSRNRVDLKASFRQIFATVVKALAPREAVTVALDDTIVRKSGKKTPGVGWLRDPLGPPFQTNLVRAQRLIQISASLSEPFGGVSRMIPIWVQDAFAVKKPRKKASKELWEQYRKLKKEQNLSKYGADSIKQVREWLDQDGEAERMLRVSVDGSYTNKHVLRHLPQRTGVVGRIRHDAKLHYLPLQCELRKRPNRLYGERAPTPEQLRKDTKIPWQPLTVRCNGRTHVLRIKTLTGVRWRATGAMLVRIVVIAPFGYRLRKHGQINYRQPVYLVSTDSQMTDEEVLKTFLKRWDIEVNFRDEKTLIGMGEAQVRNEHAVKTLPQMTVLSYAALHLAAVQAFGVGGVPDSLEPPKWYRTKHENKSRASTTDLLLALRQQVSSDMAPKKTPCDFAESTHSDTKSGGTATDSESAA